MPPTVTYAALIAAAIELSPQKRLLLDEVYDFVAAHRKLVPVAPHPNWKVRCLVAPVMRRYARG